MTYKMIKRGLHNSLVPIIGKVNVLNDQSPVKIQITAIVILTWVNIML